MHRQNGGAGARNGRRPEVEGLESRVALSAATGLHATTAGARSAAVVESRAVGVGESIRASAHSTIQGRVTGATNGRGLAGVRVQLIDASGSVVGTVATGHRGMYRFRVAHDGPYVVHLVSLPRWVQTSPTFADAAPTGSLAIDPATGKPYTGASWNYHTGNNDPANGPVGPAAWSKIAPAGDGPFEAPINITGPPIDLGQFLTINYSNAVPKDIINNGAQIQARFNGGAADTITLGGQVSDLAQFHYHDPSENQVNRATFPIEEHFVNLSASGAETVVAVFLQLGARNSALQPVLDAATAHLTAPNSSTTISTPIDLAGLLPTSRMGWFYEGSLTTPPLSQPVNWLVLATPITLDFAQLRQYEAVASGAGILPNARPLQPLDGRQVNRFDIDVNVQGRPVGGLDFALAPKSATTSSVGARTSRAS